MKFIIALSFVVGLTGWASSYYDYMTSAAELEHSSRQQKYIFRQCKRICGSNGVKLCSAEAGEVQCQNRKRK